MDITNIILAYREQVRRIWNEACVPVIAVSGGSFEMEENFCEIERLMFRAIVLYQITASDHAEDLIGSHMTHDGTPLANFQIRPRGDAMRVLLNREKQSGYWDYPIQQLRGTDCLISLIHFFDFDNYDGPREYEFYLGRVTGSERYPEIMDKNILIPVDEAEIHYVGTVELASQDAGPGSAASPST